MYKLCLYQREWNGKKLFRKLEFSLSFYNLQLQVQAMVVNCPEISKELLKEFVYETKGVEGKCCKEHKVVACKVGQTEYKVTIFCILLMSV